jgi:hypothetical protein
MIATVLCLLGVAYAGQLDVPDAAVQGVIDRAAWRARAHQRPVRSRLYLLEARPWMDAGPAPYLPADLPCDRALASLWERARAASPATDSGPLAGISAGDSGGEGTWRESKATWRWSRLKRSAGGRELAWWADERSRISEAQLHGGPTDLYAQHVVRDAFVRFDAHGTLDVAYVEQWIASDESYCAAWSCRRPEVPEDGVVLRTLVERDPTITTHEDAFWVWGLETTAADAWGWKTTVAEHHTPGGRKRYLAAWQEPVNLAGVCRLLRPYDPDDPGPLGHYDVGSLQHWYIPAGDDWTLEQRTSLPLLQPPAR